LLQAEDTTRKTPPQPLSILDEEGLDLLLFLVGGVGLSAEPERRGDRSLAEGRGVFHTRVEC